MGYATKTVRLVMYKFYWPGARLDIYDQVFLSAYSTPWLGGPSVPGLVRTAGKTGAGTYKVEKNSYGVQSIFVGVQTRHRGGQLGTKPLRSPGAVMNPARVIIKEYDIYTRDLTAAAPHGFIQYRVFSGAVSGIEKTTVLPDGTATTEIVEEITSVNIPLHGDIGGSVDTYTYVLRDGEDPASVPAPVLEGVYRLHVTNLNTVTTPPDGTLLKAGMQFQVLSYPAKDNLVLTEFSVNGVGSLPASLATTRFPDLTAEGIKYPDIYYKRGLAITDVGPVTGDVNIVAKAEAIEVFAEIPGTIQMTTTDCLVTAGSWELGANDFPPGIAASISTDGLIAVSVNPDLWEGFVGGVYHQTVIFHGYSQEHAVNLQLTVKDIPAYGTVWEPIGKVGATEAKDLLVATDGSVYIATADKIYRADENLTTFAEMNLSGSLVTAFGGLAEGPNGEILAMDKQYLWRKPANTDTFTQTALANYGRYWNRGYRVSANPAKDIVFLHGTSPAGFSSRVTVYKLSDESLIGTYTVAAITAAEERGKGIYMPDGSFVFMAGTGSSFSLGRYDADGVWTNPLANQPSYSYGSLVRQGGKLYLIIQKGNAVLSIRTSEDNGITWSAEVTYDWEETYDSCRAALSLRKQGYFVFDEGGDIYRTADDFANRTQVLDPNGVPVALAMMKDLTLLCLTTGTTTNLYKSGG